MMNPDQDQGHEDEEFVGVCPACEQPIDYCQGHGEIGDPAGFAILQAEREREGL